MNGKMTASTLAVLGFLFQASCGGAPVSEADKQVSKGDTQEESLRLERAPILEPASGADTLFRGEFLFGGQSLQDPNCYYSLQMRTDGGLNTWAAGWWQMPDWGAGNNNPYNYLAYWYPTESGGNANLLVFSRMNGVLWESDTWSSGSYEVVQQTDANVVMYASGGYVPWASNQVSPNGSNICNPDGTGPDGLVGMKTRMLLDTDLWGLDICDPVTGVCGFSSPNLSQCGSPCATNPACHSFTYVNGWCYTKSGQPSGADVHTMAGATSGRKLIGNYTWY